MPKISTVAIVAGSLLAAGGIVLYLERRRRNLGLLDDRVEKGGMVSKTYKSRMPIKERVGHIQDMVFKSVKDPQMRHLALAITGNGTRQVKVGTVTYTVVGANCPARDGECETRAIYNWVKKHIRYTGDIAPIKHGRDGEVEGIDVFQTGTRTAEFGGEDCDGHTILNSTLLALNGITPKMAVTAPTRFGADEHIYAMSSLPKNRPTELRAVDTTLPGEYYGKEAPHGRRKLYDA